MPVFRGRILFLSADPDKIERQLAGEDLTRGTAGALRDDISTDEITPLPSLVFFDERLASHPYTGFKAGERLPIGKDAVRRGGFAVTVGGKRYGKGSSREHSPVAELAAGIRLVIAESFERIYRQNADNIGLFTSTDFGLIERVRNGETIAIEELVAERDGIAAAVLRGGGLLRYGQAKLGTVSAKGSPPAASKPQPVGMKVPSPGAPPRGRPAPAVQPPHASALVRETGAGRELRAVRQDGNQRRHSRIESVGDGHLREAGDAGAGGHVVQGDVAVLQRHAPAIRHRDDVTGRQGRAVDAGRGAERISHPHAAGAGDGRRFQRLTDPKRPPELDAAEQEHEKRDGNDSELNGRGPAAVAEKIARPPHWACTTAAAEIRPSETKPYPEKSGV